MLWVCSDITRFIEFKKTFQSTHEGLQFIDLSRVPSVTLAEESDSIVEHHSRCVVFLGFLEPGWMLEPAHQTRMRKLFRKFPVGMVTNFTESLPYSWKNEIDTFYTDKPLTTNGTTNSLNNGSSIQDEP